MDFLVGHAFGGEPTGHALKRHAHLEQLTCGLWRQRHHARFQVRLSGDQLNALQPPHRLAHRPSAHLKLLGDQ